MASRLQSKSSLQNFESKQEAKDPANIDSRSFGQMAWFRRAKSVGKESLGLSCNSEVLRFTRVSISPMTQTRPYLTNLPSTQSERNAMQQL